MTFQEFCSLKAAGNCYDNPTPDIFFPGRGHQGHVAAKQAKSICQNCSIIQACLEYALEWERFGIWGGTTERERVSLRRTLGMELRNIPLLRDTPMPQSYFGNGHTPITAKSHVFDSSRHEQTDKGLSLLYSLCSSGI